MSSDDDWENSSNEGGDDKKKKFDDEEEIDTEAEKKEKEAAEAKKAADKARIEAAKKKKEDEQKAAKAHAKAKSGKSYEDFKRENPDLTDAQIKDLMSKESEIGLADDLLAEDEEEKEEPTKAIKLVKMGDFEKYGREVGQRLVAANRINPTKAFYKEVFDESAKFLKATDLKAIVDQMNRTYNKKLEDERNAEKGKKSKKNKANASKQAN